MYHGAKRATTAAQLAGADVVLTTYSIIESEHRRHMMPGKVTCRYCKHKFYTDRLRLHLKRASSQSGPLCGLPGLRETAHVLWRVTPSLCCYLLARSYARCTIIA